MSQELNLLPCPFCGAAPKVMPLGAWCDNDDCAIVGNIFSGGPAHWNRRATPAAQQAGWVSVRDAALDEAAKACMRATPDRAKVRALGEAAHYVACADAIRALQGKPEAASAPVTPTNSQEDA